MDPVRLRKIFDRTNGRCHITGIKLCFNNYGKWGRRGAWEVEHSIPRAKGGSDHGNNLYAASIKANRSKGTTTTRTARKKYGRTTAPISRAKVQAKQKSNVWRGAATGGLIGLCVAGPPGALVGVVIGGVIGESIKVKD